MNTKVISSKELGNNCWSALRFVKGGRCSRVFACNFPEKKTCAAVDSEILYLKRAKRASNRVYNTRLAKLISEKARR